MYIDHQQQHKQVYYSDRDYDDVLEEIIENRRKLKREQLFFFTQNSKWKIKWNNYIGGIHNSDSERKRIIQ
jgi:hypothetical protein